jgi:tetratricopeptide (TPR) repeat protein
VAFFKSLFGRDPDAHRQRAEEYIAAGHWGDARLELDKALQGLKDNRDPRRQEIEQKLSRVTFHLAQSHEEEGDHFQESRLHEEAVERYRLALNLYEKEEDIERIEKKLSQGTDSPQSSRSRLFVDEHYQELKHSPSRDVPPFEGDPLEVFEVLMNTLDPEQAEEYRSLGESFALGYAYANHGDFQQAVEYFDKALQDHADQRMVHKELGRALLFQGESQRAVDELTLARKGLQADLDVCHLLASAHSENGDPGKALEILQESLTNEPEEIETHLIIGDLLIKTGEMDNAGEAYQRALKIDPEFSETLSRMGAWALARGDESLAIEHYSEAVEHGSHVQDMVTLADLYLENERDLEGALGLLNKALYYDPQKRWFYLMRIGEVYLKKGWEDKAREVLEEVSGLIPEDQMEIIEKVNEFLGE